MVYFQRNSCDHECYTLKYFPGYTCTTFWLALWQINNSDFFRQEKVPSQSFICHIIIHKYS